MSQVNIKQNVRRFEEDVRRAGSYSYTADRLSCRLAKARITRGILETLPMAGKRVLDLGCGDGAYSLELAIQGAASVLGVDPAEAAVEAASRKAAASGLQDRARFMVGNIYDLRLPHTFDCVVLCGVLHHLPDPAAAIKAASEWSDTLLIVEPNGLNPILKVMERLSRYHREHEELSFLPGKLNSWCLQAGLIPKFRRFINFVPMMCPDWMARLCEALGPILEPLPLIRQIGCGQVIILAQKPET
jgi:SAM-dependent methyltransferase